MKNWFRATMYPSHLGDPITTVTSFSDLKPGVSLSDFQMPGVFVRVETFEISSGTSIVKASLHGAKLAAKNEADDRNMAAMYYWFAQFLSKARMIAGKDPAPLSTEKVKDVMEQLVKHPDLSPEHHLLMNSNEGDLVFMERSNVQVRRRVG